MRKLLLVFPLLTVCWSLSISQSYTWNVGAGIPDNSCSASNEFSLDVTGVSQAVMSSTYGLEGICLDIDHAYSGDLIISLISPMGKEVLLISERGTSLNFENTCLDGAGADGSIASGANPFTGTFLPEEPLGLFNQGQAGIDLANGTWILKVCDIEDEEVGTLNSFTLDFGSSPATPPPSNDACSNPMVIPVSNSGNCMGTVDGSLVAATPSVQARTCDDTGNFNDDIWFSFTANDIVQSITISNISGSSNALDIQLGQGLCGSYEQLFCYFDPSPSNALTLSLDGFVVGNDYLIRVASFEEETQNTQFKICITKGSTTSNDACENAAMIQVNPDISCTNTTSVSLQNAIPSIPMSSCSFFNDPKFDNDIWLEFTATASSHFIEFMNISGASTDLIYEVLTGSCTNLTTVYCQDEPNDAFVINNLIVNQQYFIRIASYLDAPQNITLDVCVKTPPEAPDNDECNGAFYIPISSPSCEYKIAGTLNGATMSPQSESCNFGSPFQNDVWFYFVATETAHEIEISNIQSPSNFMLYQTSEGSCDVLTQKHCFGFLQSGPFNADNLTIGTTYYFRVASLQYHYTPTSFEVCVSGSNQTPPTNDECTSPLTITPTSTQICSLDVSATLLGATGSNGPACVGSGGFDDDVWFDFTATEVSHVVELSNIAGSTQDLEVQVLDGTCGALSELMCFRPGSPGAGFSFEINDLSISSSYLVRVASYEVGIQNVTFDICIHDTIPDPPTNDECTSPLTITPTSTQICSLNVSATLLGATGSNGPACVGSGGFDDDVWFDFTATEVSHVVELSNIAGSTQDLEVQVLDGNCGALSELICFRPGSPGAGFSFEINDLTVSSSYLVRVASYEGGIQNVTFDICIHDTVPDPPVNDECANATLLIVSNYDNCDNKVNGSLLGATNSGVMGGCNTSDFGDFDDDVWYQFEADQISQIIEVSNITGASEGIGIEVLDDCMNATSIRCHKTLVDGTTKFGAGPFTMGGTYYVRIASIADGWENVNFNICVRDTAPDPPANDTCENAVELVPINGLVCSNPTFGSNAFATSSVLSNSCPTGFFFDVWYHFIATERAHVIELSNITSSDQEMNFQVLEGICGSFSEVGCFSTERNGIHLAHKVSNLNIGQDYHIRLASAIGQYTDFEICIRDTMPILPDNDACGNATSLMVNAGETCTVSQSGTLLNATPSNVSNTCSGADFDDDIWYSFQADAEQHQFSINNIVGSSTTLDIQILDGNCPTFSLVACQQISGASGSILLENLSIGNTYFIRIASNESGNQNTTFDICITTPTLGCSLIVTTTDPTGPGSLREAIACADTGDTIKFDAVVFGEVIQLTSPTINVDQNVIIHTDFNNNITLSNQNSANTDVLLNIQSILTFSGMRISGLTDESLIIKLDGGDVIFEDCEIDRLILDR